MDPFDDKSYEVSTDNLSLEFNGSGRITQLWVTDPSTVEDGEDVQFIIPSFSFGDESTAAYRPGAIHLGVRTGPDEPWVLDHNADAIHRGDDEDEMGISVSQRFAYKFPLIDQIQVTGQFDVLPGEGSQVVWEIELKNISRQAIEIGEVGFPLGLHNFTDGIGYKDEDIRRLWTSRVHIHKYIGGASSWVHAERMTGESPGLLIFPGKDTGWEFYRHVSGSLNTSYLWEGIPIVYAHSRATVEREKWNDWFNEHTALILEPGDSRKFRIHFAACQADRYDSVNTILESSNKQTIRLIPGAVSTIDVGIAAEINGATPTKFFVSRDAVTETDYDEKSSFCFVKPEEPGPLILSFHDPSGIMCHAHLMFLEPIQTLIERRAAWMMNNQVISNPQSPAEGAILMANIVSQTTGDDLASFRTVLGVEACLADALFLAEKNARFPQRNQVKALDKFVEDFLLQKLQNPSTKAIASVYLDGTPGNFGRPMNYVPLANLYSALARIVDHYGELSRTATEYLQLAVQTVRAMFQHGWRLYVGSVGMLGMPRLIHLLTQLEEAGLGEEYAELKELLETKANALCDQEFPFAGETTQDTSAYEEVASAAMQLGETELLERTLLSAFAARSFAPSWWWCGSEKRCWDTTHDLLSSESFDRGESCLSHTTIPNSLIFFKLLDRDPIGLSESHFRKASAGMLGPWALIRNDGAASMSYCPDFASKQSGFNPYTGLSSLGYATYLREVTSLVLAGQEGVLTFACHYEPNDDSLIVKPWDGVGRKVVLRHVGIEVETSFGMIQEMSVQTDLRSMNLTIFNPCDKEVRAKLTISGLWGAGLSLDGEPMTFDKGKSVAYVELPPFTERLIHVAVESSSARE